MNPIEIVLLTGMSYDEAVNSWAAKPENKEEAEALAKFFDHFVQTVRSL